MKRRDLLDPLLTNIQERRHRGGGGVGVRHPSTCQDIVGKIALPSGKKRKGGGGKKEGKKREGKGKKRKKKEKEKKRKKGKERKERKEKKGKERKEKRRKKEKKEKEIGQDFVTTNCDFLSGVTTSRVTATTLLVFSRSFTFL